MKTFNNITLNHASKTLFAILFLFIVTGNKVQASDTLKSSPAEVLYLGNVGSNPVFQIQVNNETGEELYITVKDDYGYPIYSEVIKEKKYQRKIQLAGAELENVKFTLVLRTKKGKQVQAFQIQKTTRTVEDVAITKL